MSTDNSYLKIEQPIAITALSTLSSLGNIEDAWQAYNTTKSAIQWDNDLNAFIARLPHPVVQAIQDLRQENSSYKRLDPSVLYALLTAREAVKQTDWNTGDFGVNIGSSRGATQLFEQYFSAFAKSEITSTHTSPSTTLGNISSWVAQDLKTMGPDISHSITCSTALHALINAIAWLRSGMASQFVVGGSEAALTPFTLAQMKAMKLTPTDSEFRIQNSEFPCRALDLKKTQNTMVLGEGAGMACLELGERKNALAYITGWGYATETLTHGASLSANGSCLQKAMTMALGTTNPNDVDAIVLHAPGTIQGDKAEMEAVKQVFCNKIPLLTTNKWKIGHTFGASGILSLAMAVSMLRHQTFISVPYLHQRSDPYKTANPAERATPHQQLNTVMVNAVGFGGNAVSVLLTRV